MKNVLWIGMTPPPEGSTYLRKFFTLESVPHTVKCRVAGLGFYELYFNGRKVGDGRLEPLFTRYDVRTLYREFEVSEYLQPGENLCEIHLGRGWYSGEYADVHASHHASYRHLCKAALRLFAGKKTLLETSESWEASSSPVLHDSPRTGETFDARKLNTMQWQPAQRLMPPGGRLCKQTGEPVTCQEPIDHIAAVQEAPGVYCYDFGKNLTGTVKLSVRGSAGSSVVLKYGENLDDDGKFSQHNINWYVSEGEFQTDRYILRGDQDGESWIPSFSFHGYRYVQITLQEDVELLSLQALPLRSNFKCCGKLQSTSSELNRLLEITERTLTSNFIGYPTDCPHREKNGWLADAHLAADSMLVWYDAAKNYSDYIDMIFDYQRPNGQLPGMVPGSGFGWHWDFGPLWTTAPILLAYKCYMFTGDLQIVKKHFGKMAKYMEFCSNLQRDGLIDVGPAEWKLPDGNVAVSAKIIDSALIARCAEIMSLFAGLLNKPVMQKHFEKFYNTLRSNLELITPAHASELAILLCCGLGTPENAAELDAIIRNARYRANFGITGGKYVPRALAEYGFIDTAYRMFTQHEYPGWQWMLDHGATTLWENWQGNESCNHPMLGDDAAWAVRYLAGIKPLEAAFRKFEFAPQIPSDLDGFSWEYQLPRGVLSASWHKVSNRHIEYHLIVPATSIAEVTCRTGKLETLSAGEYTWIN